LRRCSRRSFAELAGGGIDAVAAVINHRHGDFLLFFVIQADEEAGGGHEAGGVAVEGFGDGFDIEGGGEVRPSQDGEPFGGIGSAELKADDDANLLAGNLHEGEGGALGAHVGTGADAEGAQGSKQAAFGFERDAEGGAQAKLEQVLDGRLGITCGRGSTCGGAPAVGVIRRRMGFGKVEDDRLAC
jgi:hypothetical protein